MLSPPLVLILTYVALTIRRANALSFGLASSTSDDDSSSSSTQTQFAPLGSASDVFLQGGLCRASWTPDTTGNTTWKSTTIQLMTGSNLNMTVLGTVASGIDCTNPAVTVYNYTCPEVSPNSAIYFLEYTHDNGQDPMWTTRFAIADANGKTTQPPQANQPQGGSPAIPWGQGVLISAGSENDNSSSTSSSASKETQTSAKSAPARATQNANARGGQQQQLADAFSSIFDSNDNYNNGDDSDLNSGSASFNSLRRSSNLIYAAGCIAASCIASIVSM